MKLLLGWDVQKALSLHIWILIIKLVAEQLLLEEDGGLVAIGHPIRLLRSSLFLLWAQENIRA